MIQLREVNTDNLWPICKLKVLKEQENFVATNIQSIAEAFATRNENGVALPFGIYDDETLIGFVMLGYGTSGDEDEPKVAEGNYCIWRFMIDVTYQGKGYAKQSLDAILSYIKTFPCGPAKSCWLSYEPENEHGKKVYTRYGFSENGEMCGDEVVSVIELS